ncbi:Excitatory amino acid transporter 3 [Hypsibius exemplaris]|uniref:Amino acid transporter n=1 Tax=Hypsibius exemplaris TaxID=2072580 RepID=A0A1W0XFC1_HYPEX|nr:Excitatory amino acid transporter 3 [Hypsibius exemplaris]
MAPSARSPSYNPQFTPEFHSRDCRKELVVTTSSSNEDNRGNCLLREEPVRNCDLLSDPGYLFGSAREDLLQNVAVHLRKMRARTTAKKVLGCMKGNLQLLLMLGSIGAGIALGFGLRAADIHKDQRKTMYVFFIGEIFLNMLKVVILPLIVSSLINGLAQMESQTSGQIGMRAVTYYMTTTILAVLLGIALVTIIKPGSYESAQIEKSKLPEVDLEPSTTADTFLDLIRNMFPPNIVQACVAQYRTALIRPPAQAENITLLYGNFTTGNDTLDAYLLKLQNQFPPLRPENYTAPPLTDMDTWKIGPAKYVEGMNILGVVVFSIVFGLTISKMGIKGKPLADFFLSLNEVMMLFVGLVMKLSPVGICFVVAGQILKVEDFRAMIAQLGLYFATVMAGLFIHGLVLLPLTYFGFTRKNPFSFLAGATRAFATGFATSSSSATLPITIECCEVNNGVDPRISRFVLPIGATINMDGTALYEAVAAIFVAQTQGTELTIGRIVAVSITATAAAIGAAGVPQAGLVTLVMVLDAVGVSSEFVGSILAVDWLLDRFRTTVNILGDVLGTGIVNHLCKGFLQKLDAQAAAEKNGSGGDAVLEVEAAPGDIDLPVYPAQKGDISREKQQEQTVHI